MYLDLVIELEEGGGGAPSGSKQNDSLAECLLPLISLRHTDEIRFS